MILYIVTGDCKNYFSFIFYLFIFSRKFKAPRFYIIQEMEITAEVAGLSELAEGKPLAVFPLGLPVLLIRRGAEVFALENRCAHMG